MRLAIATLMCQFIRLGLGVIKSHSTNLTSSSVHDLAKQCQPFSVRHQRQATIQRNRIVPAV